MNTDPPEPPAEILCLVRRAPPMPVTQKVNKSLARFGYAHTEPGALSDAEIAAAELLVVRGLTLDTLYADNPEGRAAWKASAR